ncbi:MAG: hypothetical protein K2W82_15630 [Candidatus Obscuribacterales bacterium]|nr:hypothetical protein [Candidatus Obscuribacterales bacterium]
MRWLIAKLGGLRQRAPSLEQVQSYADTSAKWLSRAALLLAFIASFIVFCLVTLLAVLPYITITHTLCAAPIVALVTAVFVYSLASRPADVADKTSRGLWLTRTAISLAKRLAVKKSGQTP